MECLTCSGPVPPMPRDTGGTRKLYCSPGCRARASEARARERREAELVTAPAPRPCPACGEPVTGRRYCGRRCVDHAKTLRHRSDPEYAAKRRAEWRAKARRYREAELAAMPYRAPRPTTVCATCCDRHYAKGLCRLHYDRAAAKSAVVRSTLNAVVTRDGHAEHRAVAVRITVGVLVDCPGCGAVMGAVTPARRWCLVCGTRVTLNADEVAWLPQSVRTAHP